MGAANAAGQQPAVGKVIGLISQCLKPGPHPPDLMNKAVLLCFYHIQRRWCCEALNRLFPVSVRDLLSYDNPTTTVTQLPSSLLNSDLFPL